MPLLLMRHGDAVGAHVDPTRPLSPEGRGEVVATAGRARTRGIAPEVVLHSTKARARETAALLLEELGGGAAPAEVDGLAPNDPVEPWLARVHEEAAGSTLLLVGHNPFMGILAARLCPDQPVGFDTATLACFEPEGEGFRLAWVETGR